MNLIYKSTRGGEGVTASQAILKGLADDGGLFVPSQIPVLDVPVEELAKMTYQEVAYQVMKLYLTDFTEEELKSCIDKAYDSKFDAEEIAPMVYADGAYYLELFHGATIAFKDMALSILPHLMTTSARKNHVDHEIVILTATSGDTGKAAMAGFADVEGTRIIVFYPKDGVSPVQEKQMVTQKGKNTFVVGIHGNFDDAQTGVKKMFNDKELAAVLDKNGYQFSSANSINIGRLVPQIVYYVYAYAMLVHNEEIQNGEKINVVVPTGNFGNILAAYYAKNMGLPIDRLICASNENKVLYDFFSTGTYDRNRDFVLTSSPSMDILISSNLERLLYDLCGEDSETLAGWMKDLAETGVYSVGGTVREKVQGLFYGGFCEDGATFATIRQLWEQEGYLCDTHTAVAVDVYRQYLAQSQEKIVPAVIASTANPYKFSASVLRALGAEQLSSDDFQNLAALETLTGIASPAQLRALQEKPERFTQVISRENAAAYVLEALGIPT